VGLTGRSDFRIANESEPVGDASLNAPHFRPFVRTITYLNPVLWVIPAMR
jgi:hypothetical protein